MEWQIISGKTVPPSYRDRCLKPTAGCLLQWSANRACVVPTRTPPSYQLSRANARGLAKKSYSKNKISIHVKLLMDNLTAINKMGGLSSIPASLVFDMWQWCLQRKIPISAQHIPGIQNSTADHESRVGRDSSHWKLAP